MHRSHCIAILLTRLSDTLDERVSAGRAELRRERDERTSDDAALS